MSWTNADERLLLDLLRLDTVNPLENGGHCGQFVTAQRRYAEAAAALGFHPVLWEPAPVSALRAPGVPAALTGLGEDFLSGQPNLVLSLGEAPPERTIALNFHLDTVAGAVPVRRVGDLLYGRGAVDDKGPGVAFLAAVRHALAEDPLLSERIRVLVHVVPGEEGGAMGVYGTRVVAERGLLGRLTVVAEPTRGGYLDQSTASMTLCVRVAGQGSIDDEPERGENATLLLGFLSSWFAEHVLPAVHAAGGKACLAGLHTGTAHNCVYGTGSLLVNFAYPDQRVAEQVVAIVDLAVESGLAAFTARFGGDPTTAVTAESARRITHVEWLKHGLPTLANRDEELEDLLREAGFPRHDEQSTLRPFTCDAIWLGRPGSHTVVCGPGDLAANHAHADDEHVSIRELAGYAGRLSRLLRGFADRCAPLIPSSPGYQKG